MVSSTKYKVVMSEKDRLDCHSIMEDDYELFYPTIIAVRKGKPIGVLSTSRTDGEYFASPMVSNSPFTCVGLYKLYESVLKDIGVKYYLFSVEKDNAKMINTIERLFKIKAYAEIDNLLCYIRRLEDE